MKKANILIVSVFVALILCLVSIFIVSLSSFGVFQSDDDYSEVTMKRYIAICTNPQMDGWQDVRTGLEKAALKSNVAIEFLEEGFDQDRADASCIEMAVDSGADGIIIYAKDNEFNEELDYAAANSVPVVNVINEYNHDRIFQIGTNPKLIADKMADYVDEMDVESNNIAVISSDLSEQHKSGQFRIRFSNTGKKIMMRTFQGPHVFDANKTVKEIIASEDEVDMICCLDSTATLGVAQSIVELNKVNVITIVGCGKTNEILNMIEKGVVAATIAVDYEKIGSEAIDILVNHSAKPIRYEKRVLSDVYVIDQTNVRSYIEVIAE